MSKYLTAGILQGSLLKQKLERNSDIVWAGGYPNIGTTATLGDYEFCNKNTLQISRINDEIKQVQLFFNTVPSAVWFYIFRKNGTTYDKIYAENITAKITGGVVSTVTLESGCVTKEGDLTAISIASGGLPFAPAVSTANSLRYFASSYSEHPLDRLEGNVDWDSKSAISSVVGIKLFAQAPVAVVFGDSVMAGHPGNYSGIEDSTVIDIASSISGQLYSRNPNYICQNVAKGSRDSTWVNANFATYVTALKPKLAILNSGINDIASGTVSKENFISNWTDILNASIAAEIVPVVCKITPWTAGTNEQMQTRDEWMVDLKALVDTYTTAVWCDFDTAIGQFRTGGDAGNYWDLQEIYNADNIHPNTAGYAKMAEVIDVEISKKYRLS